uniref:SH2 domain-containing protein n=1 Tax=Steinernema glaseri TaxID=37863 RepID=A0A1I7ZWP0_9BILA
MEEEHYDVPWEYKKTRYPTQRPHSAAGSIPLGGDSPSPTSAYRCGIPGELVDHRLSKAHASRQSLTARPRPPAPNENSPVEPSSSRRFGKLRENGNVPSSSSSHRHRVRASHTSFDRDNLIHDESVDRAAAENLLRDVECGCFLLRKRPEGNMALSLKSGQGLCSSASSLRTVSGIILHIKLEERENRWILGEGPSFSSVRSVIRYYSHSSHTLPIRGAEHIQLRSPVLVHRFTV